MAEHPSSDMEPTPEFDRRCIEVVETWESGAMPFKEALSHLNAFLQEAILMQHSANEARAEHLLGYMQSIRGNLNTSIRHYERSRSLYMQLGNRRGAALSDLNQGENYRFKGDFSAARRLYHACYETARDLGALNLQTLASANEGLALIAIGQPVNARRALEEALDLARGWAERLEQLPGLLCEIYYGLASLDLAEGKHADAWHRALLALEAAEQGNQPMQRGYAHRTMGEVVARLGSVPDDKYSSEPDDHFRAALEAFKEINAEAELARTMFAQARSLAERGRKTAAARKLQQVMIIFTQLGMVDDAARAAEAQLAVL